MKRTTKRNGSINGRFGLRSGALTIAGLISVWFSVARAAEPRFSESFSTTAPGALPEGFLVLDGQWGVREEANDRWLELPGSPLESFGVMYGAVGKEDWGAQARMWGTGHGRRFPAFGVSVNGVAGYRLQVTPAKKAIELLKGDDIQASAPFTWESGTWTQVRIQVRKISEGVWKVEGKAWKDGTPEPAGWMIQWDEKDTLIAGKAAVWGKPFSGTPIRFDDLRILTADKG